MDENDELDIEQSDFEDIDTDTTSDDEFETQQEPSEDNLEDELGEGSADADNLDPEQADGPDDELKITLNDGTVLTADEVESGVMLQRDYTKKAQELAHSTNYANQQAQAYQQRTEVAENALQIAISVLGEIATEPEPEMAASDPEGYAQGVAWRKHVLGLIEQFQQGQQGLTGYNQQQDQVALQALENDQTFRLQQARPELMNPQKLEKFNKAVNEYALGLGFTQDEVSNVRDHRLKLLVDKARLWDLAQKNKSKVRKRPAGKVRSKTAKGNTSPKRISQNRTGGLDRLRQSGSIEDALKLDVDL